MTSMHLEFRDDVLKKYPDVLTHEAISALEALAPLESKRRELMTKRMARRKQRKECSERIAFLSNGEVIPGTDIKVESARKGEFVGSEIPQCLKRQWIQGTGPAARPHTTPEKSLRNVAYALLSGADGWMFDGEDALGQIETMSLDNQRNLKLANDSDPLFLKVAHEVAIEMNSWAQQFFGKPIIEDKAQQLTFTTRIYRARGLHLADRQIALRQAQGKPLEELGASIVDLTLYVTNNHQALTKAQGVPVLYLPKIQTAEEAAYWNELLSTLESHLGLLQGHLKAYVLVEQVEAAFQLMEIRAALGKHFVGYNTGRWDYINSVADAMTWNQKFINPNIESITMTYPYMQAYEDRVRRAVNTKDQNGNCALWQGGMEPNIPVGSKSGVKSAMEKAVAGARREQQSGASGKWVAHWKMVHIVRPVWEDVGDDNQLGRAFSPLTYADADGETLFSLKEAAISPRGARNLISVALQYGNAFLSALKPADDFGDPDVLYLMEDMATGEIRASILWEWLHKKAVFTEAEGKISGEGTPLTKGEAFSSAVFARMLDEEFQKLLAADDKDVHRDSKTKTLPIVKETLNTIVTQPEKAPWYIDLLNINIDQFDLDQAKARIERYFTELKSQNSRVTANLNF
jgi:malate synthase